MAMGDEGPHAARLGERQRLAIVGFAFLDIELVGIGRDVAKQVECMGGKSWMRLRILEGAVGQPSCVVKPVEQQSGASQPVIVHASLINSSTRYPALEEFFALLQMARCLLHVSDLGEDARQRGDGVGKERKTFPLRYSANPRSTNGRASTSRPWRGGQARGEVSHAHGVGPCIGSANRSTS